MCGLLFQRLSYVFITAVFSCEEDLIFWTLGCAFKVHKTAGDISQYEGNWINRIFHLQGERHNVSWKKENN